MKKYIVCVDEELNMLIVSVQGFIDLGWKPQGGVAFAMLNSTDGDGDPIQVPQWAQAMVLDDGE